MTIHRSCRRGVLGNVLPGLAKFAHLAAHAEEEGAEGATFPCDYYGASSTPVASLEGEISNVSSFVRNVARAMPNSRAACERFPRV